MNAMILCAGLGTRFRPQTDKLAKPVLPFMGLPMAGFGLFYLENAGLTNLVVNTHHLPKTVEGAMTCLTNDQKYKVEFLYEAPEIYGSGGGIANAKNQLSDNEPFVVINGDEILLHAEKGFLTDMIKQHQQSEALVTILTVEHPDAGKKFAALEINEQGEITAISVKGTNPNYVHNCGVYVYSQRIFDFMPNQKNFHIFKDCLIPAIKRGEKVMAYQAPKDMLWFDTSGEKEYLESTKNAIELLQSPGPTAETLHAILKRFHQHFEIIPRNKGLLLLGPNAQVHESTEVHGFALLSAGADVEQGVVENVVIAPNVHVHEMVGLKNQLIV